MPTAFVHDAVLRLDEGADEGAPGAAITLALCGSWEHAGRCPLAPHHTAVSWSGADLRVRVLFAAEQSQELAVRGLIVAALGSGRLDGPDGHTSTWRLARHAVGELRAAEEPQAGRLVHDG
jgi:hypothetical protein